MSNKWIRPKVLADVSLSHPEQYFDSPTYSDGFNTDVRDDFEGERYLEEMVDDGGRETELVTENQDVPPNSYEPDFGEYHFDTTDDNFIREENGPSLNPNLNASASLTLRAVPSITLTAKIQHPPRELSTYVRQILPRRFAQFTSVAETISKIIESTPEDLFRDFLSDWDPRDVRVGDLSWVCKTAQQSELRSVLHWFDSVKEPNFQMRVLGYMAESADRSLEEDGWLRNAEQVANGIDAAGSSIDDAYKSSLEYGPRYYEYTLSPNTPELLRSLVKGIRLLRPTLQEMSVKLKEQLSVRTDERRPAHEKVETLYHASVNARQLVHSGFSAELPEKGGIGGSQTGNNDTKGISFTSDIYVAKEVAKSLKEVIGIANGEYRWRDVVKWIAEAGLNVDEIIKNARNTWMSGREVPNKYRQKDTGWNDRSEPLKQDPKNVFALYKTYLAYAGSARKRYDPVYFSVSIDTFKGMDSADVGVLSAQVDMTDPGLLYAQSMHEWRVPPRAIIGLLGYIGERNASKTANKSRLTELIGLASVYDTYKEFRRAWSLEGFRGQYWHITEDQNFAIRTNYNPKDTPSGSGGDTSSGIGGLMVTTHPEDWAEGLLSGTREYAAQIDLSQLRPGVDYADVSRGYGHEIMIHRPDKAKVVRVVPLKNALSLSRRFHRLIRSEEELEAVWAKAHPGTKEASSNRLKKLIADFGLDLQTLTGDPTDSNDLSTDDIPEENLSGVQSPHAVDKDTKRSLK